MAQRTGGGAADKANLSLGLGIATVAAWVVGIVISGETGDENDWIWFVMAGLGVAAIATAFMARTAGKFPRKAMVGLVLGALFVLIFLAFALGIVG